MNLYSRHAVTPGFGGPCFRPCDSLAEASQIFVPQMAVAVAPWYRQACGDKLLEIIIKHFVTFRNIFIDDTFADDTFADDTLDFEGESQCMNESE
jgi:hypothetical protein